MPDTDETAPVTREELEETVASTICCHTRMSPAVQWEIDLLMGAIDKHTARLRERAETAEAALREVLATFSKVTLMGDPAAIGYIAEAPIAPADFARWQAHATPDPS